MDGLSILTNISIILLLGLLCTMVSRKLKISNVLILVLLGIILQFFVVNGNKLFDFGPDFLIAVSILAIVMIVFDGTSRFRWRDLDQISLQSLKLVGWFTLANTIILSFVAMVFIFENVSISSYLYAMMLIYL